MSKVTKNLISFKNGLQIAEINGIPYQFDFSENELAESIEANNNELSRRSGLHPDDYSPMEMAIIIAEEWDEADVFNLIDQLPANELADYRKELTHAA